MKTSMRVLPLLSGLLLILGLSACVTTTSEEELQIIPKNQATDVPTLEDGLQTGDRETAEDSDDQN